MYGPGREIMIERSTFRQNATTYALGLHRAMRLHMVWYGMVNVDLYGAIITKLSNALNTLVSGEKPGFQTVVIIGQFCPTLHSLTPAGHPGARGLTQISYGPILNFNFRKTFF